MLSCFLCSVSSACVCSCKSQNTLPQEALNRHKVSPSCRGTQPPSPPPPSRGSCSQRLLSCAKFRARISLTVKYRTAWANSGFGRDGNLTLLRRQINIGICVSRYQLLPLRAVPGTPGRSLRTAPDGFPCAGKFAFYLYHDDKTPDPRGSTVARRKRDASFLTAFHFHESLRQF